MGDPEQIVNAGWVLVSEAAALTGYSEEYIRVLARRPGWGVHVGRDWLVNLEAVQAFRREMQALGPAKHARRNKPEAEHG